MTLRVSIRRIAGPGDAFPLPAYATVDAAGVDLVAALGEAVVVPPLGRVRVPTGIAIALPHGYEGQVRPRSGLAWRSGLTVLNAPGTIDADYRGEVQVILVNVSDVAVAISPGERIAQLVVAPVVRLAWDERADLDETARGAGGFGHTGA
jgi:dUTP pyrophosphatase